MKNKIALVESLIFTYQSKENTVASVIEDGNLWLTQKSIADLFDCEPNNVSYHINQIYSSNELDDRATIQIFRIVQKEGNREVAEKFALSEFEKYQIIQEERLVSDYDLFIEHSTIEEIPIVEKKK